MTGGQLATVSTALWLVATVGLFILLAGWSTGSSWGLTASLVRGIRGWSHLDGRPTTITSPDSEPLRPILDPYAFVRRTNPPASSPGDTTTRAPAIRAEVIDLGERRLPR